MGAVLKFVAFAAVVGFTINLIIHRLIEVYVFPVVAGGLL